ncbi:hypothetical protein GCM10009600_09410 [Oerskovia paurometabola]
MTPSTAATADGPVPKTFVTSRNRTIVSEVVLTEEPLVRGCGGRAPREGRVTSHRVRGTRVRTVEHAGGASGEGTPVPDDGG